MSKRRSTKTSTPNIPQETLDRARAQASGTLTPEPAPEPTATAPKPVRRVRLSAPAPEATKVTATTTAPVTKSSPRKITQAQLDRSKEKGDLDSETIAYALAHPVKHISAQELAQAYGHVLVDLRNMGVLSVGLIIVLVVLAQLI